MMAKCKICDEPNFLNNSRCTECIKIEIGLKDANIKRLTYFHEYIEKLVEKKGRR